MGDTGSDSDGDFDLNIGSLSLDNLESVDASDDDHVDSNANRDFCGVFFHQNRSLMYSHLQNLLDLVEFH